MNFQWAGVQMDNDGVKMPEVNVINFMITQNTAAYMNN